MKLRLEKGTYRYRTAHKKRQLFFVVLFILAIVAQLILRNFITAQIYKNLVTISAILTVLPMANLASPLVVAARTTVLCCEITAWNAALSTIWTTLWTRRTAAAMSPNAKPAGVW